MQASPQLAGRGRVRFPGKPAVGKRGYSTKTMLGKAKSNPSLTPICRHLRSAALRRATTNPLALATDRAFSASNVFNYHLLENLLACWKTTDRITKVRRTIKRCRLAEWGNGKTTSNFHTTSSCRVGGTERLGTKPIQISSWFLGNKQ